MQFDWSGSVSAFPDDQVSAFHDWLANVLPSSVTGAIVSIGAVNQGERTVDIQGNYSGSGDAQSEITAAVQSSGMLDINSIQFSSEIGLANSSGAIPFTDNQPPVFQPVQMPVAILGNPAINPDGSINPAYNPKPMVIDYSAPNAPPPPAVVPVVVTQAPVKTGTTDAVIGGRTGTVTRQGPLPIDAGSGDITQLPVNVIPSTPPPPPQVVYSNAIPSGTPIHWQGNVSPVPDNYVSPTLLAIQSALRAQGQDPDISLGVTNPNTGTQPLTVNTVTTGGFNSGNDAAASISSVVSSVTNLDPTSVLYTLNAGPAIVPVVVTTTPSVPIPTQPTPQLPMQPLNNPIYVPAQQVGVTTPGIPPPSPDPASTIVSGTPIQTPNIPAPTTTITVPVPTTDTINILGVQVSKTFAIIAALGVGYLLLSSGSKR